MHSTKKFPFFILFSLLISSAVYASSPVLSVFTDDIKVREFTTMDNKVFGMCHKGLVSLDNEDNVRFIRHPFTGYGLTKHIGIDSLDRIWYRADTLNKAYFDRYSTRKSILVSFDGSSWNSFEDETRAFLYNAYIDNQNRMWAAEYDTLSLVTKDTKEKLLPQIETTDSITRLQVVGTGGGTVWMHAVLIADNVSYHTLISFDGSEWKYYNSTNSDLPNEDISRLVIKNGSVYVIAFSNYRYAVYGFTDNQWSLQAQNMSFTTTPQISGYGDLAGIYRNENIKIIRSGGHVEYLRNDMLGEVDAFSFGTGGEIWISTDSYELIRIKDNEMKPYSIGSLKSNVITSVVKFQGDLIAGTFGGLAVYRNNVWNHFGKEHIGANSVSCLYAEPDRLWIGNRAGLFIYDGHSFLSVDDSLVSDTQISSISEVYRDSKGTFWAGGSEQLVYCKNDQWTVMSHNNLVDEFHFTAISDFFEDADGNIWIGTNRGLIKYDGFDYTGYSLRDSTEYRSGHIRLGKSLNGDLWAFSSDCKMYYKNDSWHTLPLEQDPFFYTESMPAVTFLKTIPGKPIFMSSHEGVILGYDDQWHIYDLYDLDIGYGLHVNDVWFDDSDTTYLATGNGLVICDFSSKPTNTFRLDNHHKYGSPISINATSDINRMIRNGRLNEVNVFSLNGRRITNLSGKHHRFGAGTYIVNVSKGNHSVVKKLITPR